MGVLVLSIIPIHCDFEFLEVNVAVLEVGGEDEHIFSNDTEACDTDT